MLELIFIFIGVLLDSIFILKAHFSLFGWLRAVALAGGGFVVFILLSMPSGGLNQPELWVWMQVALLFSIGAFLVAFANLFPKYLFNKIDEQTLLILTVIYWYLLISFAQIPLTFRWWQLVLSVSLVMTCLVMVSSLSKRELGKITNFLLSLWSVWVLLIIGLIMAMVAGWPQSGGDLIKIFGLVSFGMVVFRLFLRVYGVMWFSLIPLLTEHTWKSRYRLLKERVMEFSRLFVDKQSAPKASWLVATLGIGILAVNRYFGWLPELLLVNVYLLTVLHSQHIHR